jgi:DNA-binding YbaB/EbfC family protein
LRLHNKNAGEGRAPGEVNIMKFPGGLNIQQMMKQAQQMQEQMSREMDELRVDASAGGGVVNVTMKGDHEVISLKVDPELVKENDVEMLQDMIIAAVNEANRKVNEAMKSKLGSMLPPGLGTCSNHLSDLFWCFVLGTLYFDRWRIGPR